MTKPKTSKSSKGEKMHYSIGALIKREGKYLLIDRAIKPYGFAGIAGHVDEGESEIEALIREVREESGLKVEKYKLTDEEELDWNWCSKGVNVHYWYLFECEVSGDIKENKREVKSIGWYGINEIKKLKLEPSWNYWFKKLRIIKHPHL